ncbi:MAG: aminoglycoside phosphotransferase family protein [Bacteroidota bacterium]
MGSNEIKKILKEFNIPDSEYQPEEISIGLINRSYAIADKSEGKKKYFLQQVDHTIFPDIEGIMHNIQVVNNHFNSLQTAPQFLSAVSTKNGLNYLKTEEGDYWRLFNYVDGNTFHKSPDTAMASEAGRMFGEFLHSLNSLDSSKLRVTLPRFHDIDLRYEQFQESLKIATKTRKNKAGHLIKKVEDNITRVKEMYHCILDTCPARATHNDTKLGNLLFDDNNKGIVVVDYDTFMPGYLPLDFGDTIRSLCSTTDEDDPDLKSTRFDLSIFQAFASTFIKELSGSLTKEEIKCFPVAVPYMPFLMGLRMLTDYLNNDIYYRTRYEEHNFDRASNQLHLYMNGIEQLDEIDKIVKEIYKENI